MNTRTNYFAAIKYTIIAFVVNLLLGQLTQILSRFRSLQVDIFDSVISIIDVTKVLLVIAVVLGSIYIVFLIFTYFSSVFYQDFKIGIFEAMYNGFADIYTVYDKVKKSSNVKEHKVDFKRQIVYFTTQKGNHYSLIFQDLFGRVQGKLDSEFWATLSKPKKEYGRKKYTKATKFPNPYRVNQDFINELEQKTGNKYNNVVIISGFNKLDETSEIVMAPYEIIDILNN